MKPRKILFATVPQDGHFAPLTGLAVHLKALGHDVRWYTGKTYGHKLARLGIPHYHYLAALDVPDDKIEETFPERKKHTSPISRLKFDILHYFVLRAPEQLADIQAIYEAFPFDALVCDVAFTASLLVKDVLRVPVVSIGVVPLSDTSVDLAPSGLGLPPATGYWGRKKQAFLRFFVREFLFKGVSKVYNQILESHGVVPTKGVFWDSLTRRTDLHLQIGVPGFEYTRRDLSANVRFVGALLPYRNASPKAGISSRQLKQYVKIILVTQGTVEKDSEKLLVPTLEAFKDTDYLVIATTGGSQTAALRTRFPQANILIEDFIPFESVMPLASVYVTNGGYGGVMLALTHQLPLVVAGVNEGKSEVNARVGYFQLGVNLKTERPTPAQIRKGVEAVLANPRYKQQVQRLSEELRGYAPYERCATHLSQLLEQADDRPVQSSQRQAQLALQG